jgi:tRNA U34 2-thiouridine synthase MnmA/TrmU
VKKALVIFSGGLDSLLSSLLIMAQGIKVEGVYFSTPFFPKDQAIKSANQIKLHLQVIDITTEILDIIKYPLFGYGQGLNPCLDCHLFMCKKACEIMSKKGYDFIISGEVLGQRPLSQTKEAILKIAKQCPCHDFLLRPLSAKLLPPTIPEQKNIVQREKLLDIKGRSRKKQLELANRFGLKSYPSPAGGCLLTDKAFALKLKDLLNYQKVISHRDLELLKVGRHFRLNPSNKAIVGRNKEENEKIASLSYDHDAIFQTIGYPGPLVLVPAGGNSVGQKWAAILTVSYSDLPLYKNIEVRMRCKSKEKLFSVAAHRKEELAKYLIKAD